MSSLVERSFVVIGKEQEFLNLFEQKLVEKTGKFFNYKFIYGGWNECFEVLNEADPVGIIVDFTTCSDVKQIVTQIQNIVHLKSSQSHKRIPIIGLFDSKEQINEYCFVMDSGINYFHILGDDLNLFFGNVYYIAFEDESYCIPLARAIKLYIECQAYMSGYLSGFNENQALVETDIDIEESFSGKINKAFGDREIKFVFTDQLASANVFPYLKSYLLDYDFEADGWGASESESSNSVLQEDIESWYYNLENDNELSLEKSIHLSFYSKTLEKYYNLSSELSIRTVYCSFFGSFNMEVNSEKESPDFIIYEVASEDDLDSLDELLSYYSNSKKQPVILIQKHPSTSEALKKMYNIESLLVYNDELDLGSFQQMVKLVIANKKSDLELSQIKSFENSYHLSIPFDINVTSITENEITFMTKTEIPFFSRIVLKEDDQSIDLIIVPSFLNLSPNTKGYHYLGLVNSCTEEDRQVIRKIVKRFLDFYPKSWAGIKMFGDNDVELEQIAVEENEVELKNEQLKDIEVDKKVIISDQVIRKRIGDSKSKL